VDVVLAAGTLGQVTLISFVIRCSCLVSTVMESQEIGKPLKALMNLLGSVDLRISTAGKLALEND
jgi:hypothetical protein